MSERTFPALPPTDYWEQRARRFATRGEGLAAVCSYGMPPFYNAAIQRCQRRALAPWLAWPPAGGAQAPRRALDVGCGVGRWSRLLAARGAAVTGVDLSPTMVAEAERRSAAVGLAGSCRFAVSDLARLDLGQRFDLVLGVTVLQHILDPERLAAAISRLAGHLEPGGRMVLLEAAPSYPIGHLDSPIFVAREEIAYRRLFAAAGLAVEAIGGVDPAPFKLVFLPWYRRLPRPLAWLGLAAATVLSEPYDALLARRWVGASWHKVFVLTQQVRAKGGDGAP